MSVRLSLLAVATLALSACDGQLPAPAQQAACCCKQCPADAAPPAAKTPAAAAETDRAGRTGAGAERVTTYRVRTGPRVRREVRGWSYESSSEELYGGRYGGRYGASVSVSETETSSERYSYRESTSGYGYSSSSGGVSASGSGSASGGGYRDGRGGPGDPRDGRVSRDPPHHPGYRLAGTDEDGYLTWPGKVED